MIIGLHLVMSGSTSYAALVPRLYLFFFNDTATTEIYTLSLHDALPILGAKEWNNSLKTKLSLLPKKLFRIRMSRNFGSSDSLVFSELRSEERFSRNAETDLVCRLLLEKKKRKDISIVKSRCTYDNRTSSCYERQYFLCCTCSSSVPFFF